MTDFGPIEVSEMDTDQLKALRARIDAILDGPPSKLAGLNDAVNDLKAMQARVAEVGKAAVTKALRAFMDAHPEVESLRWRQYTPYFNDGDACEFGVRAPTVKLVDGDEDSGDYEDGHVTAWSLGYDAKQAGKPEPTALMKDLKAIESLFDQAEDAMKVTFGDHAKVTVGRNGEAEVEEYDHD